MDPEKRTPKKFFHIINVREVELRVKTNNKYLL